MSDFKKGAQFMLENVEVMWAYVMPDNPDTEYEHAWKVDAILGADMAESMKAAGFNVREKKGNQVLVVKSKCVTKDGKAQKPPKVIGRNREPFTEEVGNGSICNVQVWGKEWNVSGKSGTAAYLSAVQVKEHVARDGGGFGDLDGGTGDDAPF